jgi:hypothetical protein
MLHDGENICGLFRVEDRYIIAQANEPLDEEGHFINKVARAVPKGIAITACKK